MTLSEDTKHRTQATTALREAETRLKRFRKATHCLDRKLEIQTVEEKLSDASAHEDSIERPTVEDRQLRARLAKLNSVYQHAWEQFNRR